MPQGLRERKQLFSVAFKKEEEEEMKLNRRIEQHKLKSIAQQSAPEIIF